MKNSNQTSRGKTQNKWDKGMGSADKPCNTMYIYINIRDVVNINWGKGLD